MKQTVLHATLVKEDLVLMATDMVSENGLVQGNTVSLLLSCRSEKEINDYYANLSRGATVMHPLHLNHWGALFGDLVDRYGNQWLLHYDRSDGENTTVTSA